MGAPAASFSLLAGWLVDGAGRPPLRRALVRVEGGTISGIRELGGGDAGGPGALDFTHCTLIPGLVDSHAHLAMSGTQDPAVRERQLNPSFEQARAAITRHLSRCLAFGVVAVRDGGDAGGHVLRFKQESLGKPASPVLLKTAGKAWRAAARYGKLIGRPPDEGETLEQALSRCTDRVDHVKIVNSGLNSLRVFGKESPPQFGPEELSRAVAAARRRGLRTMIHANGRLPVRLAIDAGCDSIEHGFFMGSENCRRMADRGIAWVPTAVTMHAYHRLLQPGSAESDVARRNRDHQLGQISLARTCGVLIAAGTDAGSPGVHHGSALLEEMRLLMEAGFSIQGAVQCAASNAALLLGLERDLGSLLPGMPATFIAVRGNPDGLPESLAEPAQVFVRGRAWAGTDRERIVKE